MYVSLYVLLQMTIPRIPDSWLHVSSTKRYSDVSCMNSLTRHRTLSTESTVDVTQISMRLGLPVCGELRWRGKPQVTTLGELSLAGATSTTTRRRCKKWEVTVFVPSRHIDCAHHHLVCTLAPTHHCRSESGDGVCVGGEYSHRYQPSCVCVDVGTLNDSNPIP